MAEPAPRSAHVPPELHLAGFNCPHCGIRAHQDWSALGYEDYDEGHNFWTSLESVVEPPEGDSDPFASGKVTHIWNGARCFSCGQWSIWHLYAMVYPPVQIGAAPNPDMPEETRSLYIEARQVATVSRRAGAGLARAAVERLLKLLDTDAPSSANLETRIARLRDRVSSPLGQLLDVVRVTGNQALHIEDQPPELLLLVLDDTVGPGVLETLLQVANDLVDELITRPRRTQDLWEKLPGGVRARLSAESARSTNTS